MMRPDADEQASETLYQRLLGARWAALPEAIRALHLSDGRCRAAGVFRVRNGRSIAARALLRLLRWPRDEVGIPTRLVILRDGDGERWLRRFGRHRINSRQRRLPDGSLGETFGLLEFRFALEIEEEGLTYRQIGASLRCGNVNFPLPRWIAPCVTAREAVAGRSSTRVHVEVTLPLGPRRRVGLISYDGVMDAKERKR